MIRSSKFVRCLAIALCCVIFLFCTMEAAHVHATHAGDLGHCPLCAVSQLALQVPITGIYATLLLIWISLFAPLQLRKLHAPRLIARIRPPPATSCFA